MMEWGIVSTMVIHFAGCSADAWIEGAWANGPAGRLREGLSYKYPQAGPPAEFPPVASTNLASRRSCAVSSCRQQRPPRAKPRRRPRLPDAALPAHQLRLEGHHCCRCPLALGRFSKNFLKGFFCLLWHLCLEEILRCLSVANLDDHDHTHRKVRFAFYANHALSG